MAISNKENVREYVQCIHCKKAKALMQWFKNPIIAVCSETEERQVAETNRLCKLYVRAREEEQPALQHFDSYDNT